MMKIAEAIAEIKSRIRPGKRGCGCFAIHMVDEKTWAWDDCTNLLERFSDDGILLERICPDQVSGDVKAIECHVDESGWLIGQP